MSQCRACEFWLATNGSWYMQLGRAEHDYDEEDCDDYGPFSSFDTAYAFLDNFSNPGSFCKDESGKRPPPEKPQGNKPPYNVARFNYFR